MMIKKDSKCAPKKPNDPGCSRLWIWLTAILFSIPLFGLSTGAAEKEFFYPVTGPCGMTFPKDHGPHPGYRTEWWYYTGNLKNGAGTPYGFQLTFFRRQLSPVGSARSWPQPPSAWRTGQLYMAHAAVSDIPEKGHLYAQRISRSALKMAGGVRTGSRTELFVQNWRLRITPHHQFLTASAKDFSFALFGTPLKPPVLHGASGYSRKGSTPERASCYYSFSRLSTEGNLTIRGKSISVKGYSWMDHEFSTAPLEPDIVGWDWFGLQLSDQTELMIYLLRKKDGSLSRASSGTYVDDGSGSVHLRLHDIDINVLRTWKSAQSGAVYPAGWQIVVPSLSLVLKVTPQFNHQEMQTTATTGVTYWEGSVSAAGTRLRKPIQGQGYVELTGYDKPMDAPM